MVDVASTGIGRASEIITNTAGKGNKGDKFRVFKNKDTDVSDFGSFFESKIAKFEANMTRAAENQSNGQSHGRD